MEETEKWLIINQCENKVQLAAAIMIISEEGVIRSNRQDKAFDAQKQVRNLELVIEGGLFPNILTRAYGIRQQAIYIRYYEQREREYGDNNSRISTHYGPCDSAGVQATSANPDGRAN